MKTKMQKLKSIAHNLAFSIKMAYLVSPSLFIISSAAFMAVSVFPYLPLFLWKNVLNEIMAAVSGTSVKTAAQILMLVGFYVLSLLAQCVLKQINSVITTRYDAAIKYYMDNFCVEKMSRIKYAFFDDPVFADKISHANRTIYDIMDVSTVFKNILYSLTKIIVSGIILGRFAFWIVPLILLLCVPRYFITLKISAEDREFQQKYEKTMRKRDYYYGLFFGAERLEITLYGIRDFFLAKYNKEWKKRNDAYDRKSSKQFGLQVLSSVIVLVSDILFYSSLAYKAVMRIIGIGDVTYYISILAGFTEESLSIVDSIITLNNISEELDYVRDFIELDSGNETGGEEKIGNEAEVFRIEFDDVCFTYPNSENEVLKHCSFKITSKEKIGIVGENGSGKSTILKLLLRFYEPTSGRILLNGKDISEYDLAEYRGFWGAMFQDSVDYSLTARENIILSDFEKAEKYRNTEDKALETAIQRSRLSEIVSLWDAGLETQLTKRFDENGQELSGGQWKRFAIARTYYRDSKEILLDEPSASLDPVAEHEIFTEFTEVSHEKGAVMITHRILNLIDMDRILILHDGSIAEDGPHKELMKRNGIYANMFNLQASKYV